MDTSKSLSLSVVETILSEQLDEAKKEIIRLKSLINSQSKEGEELSKEEIAVIEKMADETYAGSEAIIFAEWLRENNMRPNGFGGWVGEINTNFHGSSEIKLYRLFKKMEHAKTKR